MTASRWNSIWNKYDSVGSKYNSQSPFNKYGTGLKIFDDDGIFYGNFKIGYAGATRYSKFLKELVEEIDDRSDVRDAFCD